MSQQSDRAQSNLRTNGTVELADFRDNDDVLRVLPRLVTEDFVRGNQVHETAITKGEIRAAFSRFVQSDTEIQSLSRVDQVVEFCQMRANAGLLADFDTGILLNLRVPLKAQSSTVLSEAGTISAPRLSDAQEVTADNLHEVVAKTLQQAEGTADINSLSLIERVQLVNDIRVTEGLKPIERNLVETAERGTLKRINEFTDGKIVVSRNTLELDGKITDRVRKIDAEITRELARKMFSAFVLQDSEIAALPRSQQIEAFNAGRIEASQSPIPAEILSNLKIEYRLNPSSLLVQGEFGAGGDAGITAENIGAVLDKFLQAKGINPFSGSRAEHLLIYNRSREDQGFSKIPAQLLANAA